MQQISADNTELPGHVENPNKTIRSVSVHVDDSLKRLLHGETIPKKSRSPHDAAAYGIKGKKIASLSKRFNPLSGSRELRTMVQGTIPSY